MKHLDFTGQHVLVLGYARSGRSVAEFLLDTGAQITINDRGDQFEDPSVSFLRSKGIRFVFGGHPLDLLDSSIDLIVKNPGIPYQIPFIQRAIDLEIPIITDIELASRATEAQLLVVTGSNGKTTTASLIHHILARASQGQTFLVGNIGKPILDAVSLAGQGDTLVVEASSFQLQGTQAFRPHILVYTNIYSAHLDYHGSQENYTGAKLRPVANMTAQDVILYNGRQGEFGSWLQASPAQKMAYNGPDTCQLRGDYLYYQDEEIISLDDIKLPGQHNIENIQAAVTAAKVMGIETAIIQQGIASFQGMPHRIEYLGALGDLDIYNDSKATNTVATITALKSFPNRSIILIAGGLDRGNDFDDLLPYLDGVVAGYFYGQCKEKLQQSFDKTGIPTFLYENLAEASQAIFEGHPLDEPAVVLLSPAAASWDQFDSFEQRGDHFKALLADIRSRREASHGQAD